MSTEEQYDESEARDLSLQEPEPIKEPEMSVGQELFKEIYENGRPSTMSFQELGKLIDSVNKMQHDEPVSKLRLIIACVWDSRIRDSLMTHENFNQFDAVMRAVWSKYENLQTDPNRKMMALIASTQTQIQRF